MRLFLTLFICVLLIFSCQGELADSKDVEMIRARRYGWGGWGGWGGCGWGRKKRYGWGGGWGGGWGRPWGGCWG